MKLLALLALLQIQGTPSPRPDTGVVSGHLFSNDGTPASEVRVAVMEAPVSAPVNAPAILSFATTGKDGRFLLENIPPGRYFIFAGMIDSPTFYPGTSTPAGATAIQVLAGRMIEDVDFSTYVPAGFKVGGQLTFRGSPTGPTNVVLTTSKGIHMDTAVHSDGSFEFVRVPPGQYLLASTIGTQRLSVLITDQDISGIPLSGDVIDGVQVSGKIVTPDISSSSIPGMVIMLRQIVPVVNPSVPTANTTLPQGVSIAPARSRWTRIGVDGTFEFMKVPPGNYETEVETGFGPTQFWHFVVGDKDATGLQFSLPYQLEIPGRIVMEDGSQSPISSTIRIGFSAAEATGTSSIGIVENGSFRLRLREGESRIEIRNLTQNYVVKSMLSGTIDMLHEPVKIVPGQKFEEIVLTLAAEP